MIPMRQFEISLNTQSLSNKLFQTVVQGSQDTELLVTVLQDGKSISIADDANIILNVLYNGKTNPAYETKPATLILRPLLPTEKSRFLLPSQ